MSKMDCKFFTGFTEAQVEVITEALLQALKYEEEFDYPKYGGLPRRISDKFSSDAVDYLQQLLDHKTISIDSVARALAMGHSE